MTNLPKPSLDDNTNFVTGDFVVLTPEEAKDVLLEIIEHKYTSDTYRVKNVSTGSCGPIHINLIRHATTAEVKAKRRLPQLTEFLGDDKHVENNISPKCRVISNDVHIHLSKVSDAQKEIS